MGGALIRHVTASGDCNIVAATETPGHASLGTDCGALAGLEPIGVTLGDDAEALFRAADAVLDFTLPVATARHAALAAAEGTILVVGTTGLGADEQRALEEATSRTTIVQAPNMSLCVNLLMRLTEQVAGLLDDDYDIEIVEMHHRHKVDAPSGTALGLGKAAALGRGVSLDEVAARGRDGVTGARPRGAIGFAALRGGDVVGDHSVIFAADGERLELTHRAASRETYARGALRAARWAEGRKPGLYTMADVLGLA
jgi:4-hydroxy-tetrahydrodipicolinate reductase